MTTKKTKKSAPSKAVSKPAASKQLTQLSSFPLAIRVPFELLAQIDAEVERLKKENPGHGINRADIVRNAIIRYFKDSK